MLAVGQIALAFALDRARLAQLIRPRVSSLAIGVALPLVVAGHVLLGWRSRQVRAREQPGRRR